MHDAKLFYYLRCLVQMVFKNEEVRVSIYYFSKNVIIISFNDSFG